MSNQARVGLFTLIGLVALFFVFYILENLSARRGYQIGIHFANVAGLKQGGYVLQSGVIVGDVADVQLLPDNSVEATLNIRQSVEIPSNAVFTIQVPITGDPYLNIVLPKSLSATPAPPLPHQVLPLEEQPRGRIPVTLADLMATGQNEADRLDHILADIERREPQIAQNIEASSDNVRLLSQQLRGTVSDLSRRSDAMASQLQQSLGEISANLIDVSGALRKTVDAKGPQIDRIVDNLTTVSQSLVHTANAIQNLAGDPRLHQNVVQTTTELRNTAHSIAQIAEDLHHLTGDPQTQAQLHNAAANVDAATQRLTSLLGKLGGESHVYGVDAGATPEPTASGTPAAVPGGGSAPRPTSFTHGPVKEGALLSSLVAVKLRIGELSKSNATSFDTPLLSRDRGPQSDLNLIVFPQGSTSVELGANDLGGYTTVNAAIFRHTSPNLRLGGGVLYSRLGVAGSAGAGAFGLDGLLYDLRHPTLDLYGRLKLTKGISGFAGERDLFYDDRRPVFGLEFSW